MFDNPQVKALTRAIAVLDALGEPYWLCNGTLLGLIRAGELIPWDGDLDFGMWRPESRSAIRTAFQSAGFSLHDVENESDYMTFLIYGTKVDLNFFSERDSELVTLWRVPKNRGLARVLISLITRLRLPVPDLPVFWVLEGYALPTEKVFPLEQRTFYGVRMTVPRSPEEVLEYTYGADWRMPNEKYDWRKDGQNNAHE